MVLLLLYVVSILLGVINRNSKYLFVWIFAIAWLMIAGNYANPDYEAYETRYDIGLGILLEPGFGFLCDFFKYLGYDYFGFKAFVSFICLYMVFYSIRKLSLNISLGATLFILYPFIIDITQFRNFIAYSIVVFGIPFLYERTRKGAIKYCATVIVASLFHTSVFFYILFLLARKKINRWHIGIGIILIAIIKVSIYNAFQTQFDTDKLGIYDKPSIIGALFLAFLVIMNAIVVWRIYMQRKKTIGSDLSHLFQDSIIWPNISLLLLLLIPLFFDNATFTRLFRNMIFLNFIYIANSSHINKMVRNMIILSFLIYYTSSYFTNPDGNVFFPVFFNNSLIELL